MIIEERQYHIYTGLINEFWKLYKTEGLPIQTKYQKNPLGFFFIEIGEIGNFMHMWAYKSLEHRDICRQQLHDDEEWKIYAKKSHQYIISMKSRILKPLDQEYTDFFTSI